MSDYIKLIRVKHWLKNFLVFLPVFFSINILKISYLDNCLLAFIIFSFASSIVYVLNDIKDIEKDKLHPKKKNRPLASGKITIKNAKITIFILSLLMTFMVYIIYINSNNILTLLIPFIYIFINILYSNGLKNIPIIDVVILVSGFVLRVMYGGVVINVDVSKWLYLMIIFGAFYLGFGKRRNEIIKNGKKGRNVLKFYTKEFLDKNMYVCLSLAIVAYSLWCVDPVTISRIGNDYLFWTIPLIMIILQLYSLNIEGNSYGDPIEVILSDKALIVTVMFYIIIMGGLLYVL